MLLLDLIEGVSSTQTAAGQGMRHQADQFALALSDRGTPLLRPELVVRRSTSMVEAG